MVEGPKATQVTSLEQINQENLQEYLAKTSVWDFHKITRDEYMNKSDIEKKDLIISFFNYMSAGNIFHVFLCCLEFDFLLCKNTLTNFRVYDYYLFFHQ